MAHNQERTQFLPSAIKKIVNHKDKSAFLDGDLHDVSVNDSDRIIEPQKIKKTPLTVRYIKSEIEISEKAQKIMAAAIVYRLWAKDGITKIESLELYLEVFVYFFGRDSITKNPISRELSAKNYSIEWDELLISPTDFHLLTDIDVSIELDNITEVEELSQNKEILEGLMYTVILLMGKNLIENSVQIWVQKRVQNFCATLGCPVVPALPSIPLSVVRQIYSSVSSMHGVRKEFFRVLQASSSRKDRYSTLSEVALGLLSYTEMGHIQVIFEYILCNYSELLQMRHLQGDNIENFGKVLEYMCTVPEPDRPFIKLLLPPQQTKIMHRDRFPLIIDAAYQVATWMRPTFKNYRGATHTSSQAIEKEVKAYLDLITNRQTDLMMANTYQSINETIRSKASKAREFFTLNTDRNREEDEERD